MVKFVILLHTIYKCLCVVALDRYCSSDGADETPVPFCPAQDAVLVEKSRHGNNRENNKVSWAFITVRGLTHVCQSNSAMEHKKITENGTLLIYRIYFLYIYI